MSTAADAETLARTWIERWNAGEPDLIPLAEDFAHTSPYGRVSGRKTYLDWVKPLAKENVTTLRILRTVADGNNAVIHFEMHTPNGVIPACDWVVAKDGEIVEIHSFYDTADLPAPPEPGD